MLGRLYFRLWTWRMPPDCRLVRVQGWRTFLVDRRDGRRESLTPLFWFDRD